MYFLTKKKMHFFGAIWDKFANNLGQFSVKKLQI